MEDAEGGAGGIDTLSNEDAMPVLGGAAEVPAGNILPDAARELHLHNQNIRVELCGRVAMNAALAGRWSTVRRSNDPPAWSRAATAVCTELQTLKFDEDGETRRGSRKRRCMAVLRADFLYLRVENDHAHGCTWLWRLCRMIMLSPFVMSRCFCLANSAAWKTCKRRKEA